MLKLVVFCFGFSLSFSGSSISAEALKGFSFVEIGMSTGQTYVLPILEKSPVDYQAGELVQDLTLLSVRKQEPYQIAEVSKLRVTFEAKDGGIFPVSLLGDTPDGLKIEVTDLEAVFQTMELKPNGTIIPTFCKFEEPPTSAVGTRITSVCLSVIEGQ